MSELHHANIVIGKDCSGFVFDVLAKDLNFNTKANPDFLLIKNHFFGIDDAREFEKWVIGKPLLGDVKVSLIIVKSITHEAQNALLKVLEEPPAGTYIFINIESLGGLAQTFLSRVRIIKISSSTDKIKESSDEGRKFINSSIENKLSMARKMDKDQIKELIKDLEISARKNGLSYSKSKAILTAKVFASTRGSSPKMLLEWLSCVI